MNIVIALVFCFIVSYFVKHKFSGGRRLLLPIWGTVSSIFFAVGMFLVAVLCCVMFLDKEYYTKIPFTSVDASEWQQADDGVFCLYFGTVTKLFNSEISHGDYIVIDDETTSEDILDWRGSKDKAVYIAIKDGIEVKYRYGIGYINWRTAEDCEKVFELYEHYKETGEVPKTEIRYKFLFFYIDVQQEF